MKVTITSQSVPEVEADWLVVACDESGFGAGTAAEIDALADGLLTQLREAGDFKGKSDQTLVLYHVPGLASTRLLLVGLGDRAALGPERIHRAMMTAARKISQNAADRAAVAASTLTNDNDSVIRTIAAAFTIGGCGQDLYRAERERFETGELLIVVASDDEHSRSAGSDGLIIGEAVNLTRELVNRPAAEVYPESFADRAGQLARENEIECTVLDEQQLLEERMNSMLAVARGSDRPARLVVLEYNGAGSDAPVLGLIGKGVTFDSGGLSLKTSDGMMTMKCDMAGAATVLATVVAAARLKLTVNLRVFMGLVENMVSGSSYKLGDVLTARNGKTIEVHNTDAEGRLVLADVLSYACDSGVAAMIDVATLTGSCVVALGEDVTGAFTSDQAFCDRLKTAAADCGEPIWQLPMFDSYSELIKGEVADIKNVGSRWGGAITAAKFLQEFVGDEPWIHLDIAGPSFAGDSKAWRDGGATGCMVRTLIEFARRFGDDSSEYA